MIEFSIKETFRSRLIIHILKFNGVLSKFFTQYTIFATLIKLSFKLTDLSVLNTKTCQRFFIPIQMKRLL